MQQQQQQQHDFAAQRHVGPAVGVLPSQTDVVGMQIPPRADDRWPVGLPVVRCFPAGRAADRPLHSGDVAKIG